MHFTSPGAASVKSSSKRISYFRLHSGLTPFLADGLDHADPMQLARHRPQHVSFSATPSKCASLATRGAAL